MVIKNIRKELKLSQKELGEAMGRDQAAVSHTETDRQSMTTDYLIRFVLACREKGRPTTFDEIMEPEVKRRGY